MKFVIQHKNPHWGTVRRNAIAEIMSASENGDCMVSVTDVVRSLDQNAKQWPMLRDIADQVPLRINGQEVRASEADFKAVLTAAFTGETRFAESPFGGLVAIGISTRSMPKKQFVEYIEFLYAFGTDKGVIWSEKAKDDYAQYGARK